ncbi:2-keto-4-pentenoate hydratase [Mycobacterium sp. shizuoka-1]|uniref:2-keto-4-pentenoate hydratase n=1 Tax=Mycobacterium sp. shizuoka-1 TaxID=2039281 RepID=UPI000C0636BB|nr:fumarylacetoacetate hydrolase family protein [Mycobacterium sp. shizuoka-1]GAY17838.1 4-oxalocrotonate decarboxylase [Mycobacterium sp. shizuoka-1]
MEFDDIAHRLDTARARRTAVTPFSDTAPDFDVGAGYHVQRRRRAGRALAGWKLALTSRAKQRQVGLDAAMYGFLGRDDALAPGQALNVGSLIAPRVEPELVFIMGDDIAGPGITGAQVLAATAEVAAGIEVIDSRYLDYRFSPGDLAADNASAANFLIGPGRPPQDLELPVLGVVLAKNGELVDTATGAAVMGHPAAAVAWLVRRLHTQEGLGLRRGQIVFSGGLTGAVPVGAADTVTAEFAHLGRLTLDCR